MADDHDVTADQTPSGESDTKECPYCAEPIKARAIKCRYCGSDLTPPPPTELTLDEAKTQFRCPRCRSALIDFRQRGFSEGRAVAAGLLADALPPGAAPGGRGLAAALAFGAANRKEPQYRCLVCGKSGLLRDALPGQEILRRSDALTSLHANFAKSCACARCGSERGETAVFCEGCATLLLDSPVTRKSDEGKAIFRAIEKRQRIWTWRDPRYFEEAFDPGYLSHPLGSPQPQDLNALKEQYNAYIHGFDRCKIETLGLWNDANRVWYSYHVGLKPKQRTKIKFESFYVSALRLSAERFIEEWTFPGRFPST